MDNTKFESTMAEAQAGAETALEKGKDVYDKAQEMAQQGYQKASEKVGTAYRRTSEAMSGAYDSGVGYVRENPAMMTLVAMGIGVGVGFLLGASLRRPARTGRFTTPIVDAVYDMVADYLR
jgi:ElaB/YqjD/DUF883 family membrane-anchored ribosome-binding protein